MKFSRYMTQRKKCSVTFTSQRMLLAFSLLVYALNFCNGDFPYDIIELIRLNTFSMQRPKLSFITISLF